MQKLKQAVDGFQRRVVQLVLLVGDIVLKTLNFFDRFECNEG